TSVRDGARERAATPDGVTARRRRHVGSALVGRLTLGLVRGGLVRGGVVGARRDHGGLGRVVRRLVLGDLGDLTLGGAGRALPGGGVRGLGVGVGLVALGGLVGGGLLGLELGVGDRRGGRLVLRLVPGRPLGGALGLGHDRLLGDRLTDQLDDGHGGVVALA